jgi:hypothetical protein
MFVQFNQASPNVGLYVNAQLYYTRAGVTNPIPGATLALGLVAAGTGQSFGSVDFSGALVPGTSTPITPAAVGAPPAVGTGFQTQVADIISVELTVANAPSGGAPTPLTTAITNVIVAVG